MTHDGVALIKENLSITDLIGRYVQLKRKGAKMTACCPFHNEKTPSFYVDQAKGFYHCFGCGAGGDLIKFAMEIEGFSFVEALDFLADIAGVELPKRNYKGPSRDVIEAIRAIYVEAAEFYHGQLRKNKAAMQYLLDRGVRETTINLFKIGYSPNQWEGLLTHMRGKFEPKMLENSGLFKIGKSGKPFDLFRDRVMFPIQDAYGNVVAFGGRMIADEEGPKYINSPESPIYTKGKHLYNINFARAFLKKQPEVVVTEGYMDAIQVYQAGMGNVIAGLGTAFTTDQARLVKRYTNKVILNFDGDRAGFKAARIGIEIFLKQDMEIGVVTLPDSQDPDDFIKEHGIKAYREQVENARGFYDFLLEYLAEGVDLAQDPRQRSFVAQEMCHTLQHIQDPVVQDFYLEKISSDLEVSTPVLRKVMDQKSGEVKTESASRPQPARNRVDFRSFNKIEQEFLYHVMHKDDFKTSLKEEHQELLPKVLHQVFNDRPWVLDFIYYGEDIQDFESRLKVIPLEFKEHFRSIFFEHAFEIENKERLEELFPELLRQMLKKLADLNKQRLRTLPPHEEEKIRLLRRQIHDYMKQYHILNQ